MVFIVSRPIRYKMQPRQNQLLSTCYRLYVFSAYTTVCGLPFAVTLCTTAFEQAFCLGGLAVIFSRRKSSDGLGITAFSINYRIRMKREEQERDGENNRTVERKARRSLLDAASENTVTWRQREFPCVNCRCHCWKPSFSEWTSHTLDQDQVNWSQTNICNYQMLTSNTNRLIFSVNVLHSFEQQGTINKETWKCDSYLLHIKYKFRKLPL